ncbi:unnamed protein product, partial [Phaeothamnion confervicola]
YFSVSGPRAPRRLGDLKQSKVAPGMEVSFEITFSPQEIRDYSADLLVITEREKFVVPLRALGPRAALDFPDAVAFPATPVKATASRTLVVHNVGAAEARVALSCRSSGGNGGITGGVGIGGSMGGGSSGACTFSVSPAEAAVLAGAGAVVEVGFAPTRAGAFCGELIVSYDDGRQAFVALSGAAGDVDVCLSAPSVRPEPAYIGLVSRATVRILNDSETPVRFAFAAFASAEEEEAERERLRAELAVMQAAEEAELAVAQAAAAAAAAGGEEATHDKAAEADGGAAVVVGIANGGANDDGSAMSEEEGLGGWPVAGGYPAATAAVRSNSFGRGAGADFSPTATSVAAAAMPLATLAAFHAARAALRRKYRHLREALDADGMLFVDRAFELSPLRGEVWARSETMVTVAFRPATAAEHGCCAYLDVVGRAERLPLWLEARGIGPRAVLSFEALDLGEVFVRSPRRYVVTLSNKGAIPADWSVLPPSVPAGAMPSPFAAKFRFAPAAGRLDVGDECTVAILFEADVLGEFSENFRIALRGTAEPLPLRVSGTVVGPTFRLEPSALDFGIVSFGCAERREVVIRNSSDVGMEWGARVPQDGAYQKREFSICPDAGTLLAGEAVRLTVTLISVTLKTYDNYCLAIDVPGVGAALQQAIVRAECRAPALRLEGAGEARFGDCFLRHPEAAIVMLRNDSSILTGRFRFLPQDAATHSAARATAEPAEGTVPPGGRAEVTLWLSCERLGPFRLPLVVEVGGSAEPPLPLVLSANGVGPLVRPDQDAIIWGATPCLTDITRPLVLRNPGKIPAPFRTFVRGARSKFRVDMREGTLGPGEAVTLVITANLDDTVPHADELLVVVAGGDARRVALAARGVGTTLWSRDDVAKVDFGAVFSGGAACIRRMTVENKGRRQQSLRWVNLTARDGLITAQARSKAQQQKMRPGEAGTSGSAAGGINGGGIGGGSGGVSGNDWVPAFTVSPEEIELRPRTAITFTFRGQRAAVGRAIEAFACESRVGKDKAARVVFRTEVAADFVAPLLEFSRPEGFRFEYVFDSNVPIAVYSQPLALRNAGALPLDFSIRAAAPFGVDAWEHALLPGETAALEVTFDPGYRSDRRSHVADGRLTVVYRDHAQRDALPLAGAIHFPNLSFDTTKVNFGCVLNDTSMTKVVRVTNRGKVDCAFSWAFVEATAAEDAAAAATAAALPISQVFDILPIRSRLRPGESEDIEFVFFGHANRKVTGRCLCAVEGGPDYPLELSGEASNVGFRLDRPLIDFGRVPHGRTEMREFYIINTGRVALPFRVLTDRVSRRGLIECYPTAGVPAAGSGGGSGGGANANKVKITVRFRPPLPELVAELLVLELGHFDPVELPIYGQGVYASVAVSLPREAPALAAAARPASAAAAAGAGTMMQPHCDVLDNAAWAALLAEARANLLRTDAALLPPPEDELPPPPAASTAPLAPADGGGFGGSGDALATDRRGGGGPGSPTGPRTTARSPWPTTDRRPPSRNAGAGAGTGGAAVGSPPPPQPPTGRPRGPSSEAERESPPPGSRGGGPRGGAGAATQAPVASPASVAGSTSSLPAAAAPTQFAVEMEANRLAYVRFLEALIRREDGGGGGQSDEAVEVTAATEADRGKAATGTCPRAGAAPEETMALPAPPDVPPLQLKASGVRSPGRATRGGAGGAKVKAKIGKAGKAGVAVGAWADGDDAADADGGTIGGTGGRGGTACSGRNGAEASIVVGRHVADFGHVIVGLTKRRTFRVVNTGGVGPLSWSFDRNRLAGTGFTVDPEKVVRLPEGAAASFAVTFHARKGLLRGLRAVELPIRLKGGPTTAVILRADVTVPEVVLSSEVLDFGSIAVGCGRLKHFEVRNVSPVAAEWAFRRATGDVRDESRFRISPRGGMLLPGQRAVVAVEFAPAEGRLHQLRLPLTLAQAVSAKTSLVLLGRGLMPSVVFDPPAAVLGPVLPGPGLAALTAFPRMARLAVTMRNDGPVDVEIYSLDFDAAFAAEDDLLRHMPHGYDADDVLRLPPRVPGEGLPAALLRHLAEADRQIAESAAAPRGAAAAGSVASSMTAADPTAAAARAVAAAAAAETAVVTVVHDDNLVADTDAAGGSADGMPEWDRVPTARERGLAHDVVVTGPPLSGVSSVAHRMAERWRYARIDVDSALEAAARLRSTLGERVRAALHRFTAVERGRWADAVRRARAAAQAEQEAAAAATATLAAATKKGGAKGKGVAGAAAAAAAAAAAIAGPAGAAECGPATLALEALLQPRVTPKLLTEVLMWRLRQPDCSRGAVLD